MSQCRYVTPHGKDGYVCCQLDAGHGGYHLTAYTVGGHIDRASITTREWLTKREWNKKYGAAARSCYADFGKARR